LLLERGKRNNKQSGEIREARKARDVRGAREKMPLSIVAFRRENEEEKRLSLEFERARGDQGIVLARPKVGRLLKNHPIIYKSRAIS
jgi:hypothetical protein